MPIEPSITQGSPVGGAVTVDPFESADRGARYRGRLETAALPRLAELVTVVDGVDVVLAFSRDDERRCEVNGQASFAAEVDCHWCLEPVDVVVTAEINLYVVASDKEASELGGIHDTHLLEEGTTTSIVALIQDDLILALPSRACTDETCPKRPEVTFPAHDAETQDQAKPFEILAALKNSGQIRSDQ